MAKSPNTLLHGLSTYDTNQCVDSTSALIDSFVASAKSGFAKDTASSLRSELLRFVYSSIGSSIETICTELDKEQQDELYLKFSENIAISDDALTNAIYRSFRRTLYCKLLNKIDINNFKSAGLLAYWVIKTHPVTFMPFKTSLYEIRKFHNLINCINELFAAHLILSEFKKRYSASIQLNYEYYNIKLTHAFVYREFSENALMLLAESLGTEGIAFAFAERNL